MSRLSTVQSVKVLTMMACSRICTINSGLMLSYNSMTEVNVGVISKGGIGESMSDIHMQVVGECSLHWIEKELNL